MIAHTDWTHTWTTMLLGSEHGYHGASPRVPRREGLGPTESHASHRLGPTGSHRARFGPRREELGLPGSHQVRIGTRARLVVLRGRFWVAKMLMLPASTIACLHSKKNINIEKKFIYTYIYIYIYVYKLYIHTYITNYSHIMCIETLSEPGRIGRIWTERKVSSNRLLAEELPWHHIKVAMPSMPHLTAPCCLSLSGTSSDRSSSIQRRTCQTNRDSGFE